MSHINFTTFNSLIRPSFSSIHSPYLKDALFFVGGWYCTAKAVDSIAPQYPFAKKLRVPLCVTGAFAVGLLGRVHVLAGLAMMGVLFGASLFFAAQKVKEVYTPEKFKELLLENHQFPSNVLVKGDLDLAGLTIRALPDGMEVEGSVYLHGAQITALPKGFKVGDSLSIERTPITELPEGLEVGQDLDVTGSPITKLPRKFRVGRHCILTKNHIRELPENFVVKGDLILDNCPIQKLPECLRVEGSLHIIGTGITFLPAGLEVGGNLLLRETQIPSVPKGLKVGGHLTIFLNTLFTSLPIGLEVRNGLRIGGAPVETLPEGLRVGGDLSLRHTLIRELPQRLDVKGDLSISESPITGLPEEKFEIGGNLDLSDCPITSLPDWITTLGPRADGRIREINLERTNLSQSVRDRLLATPAPGIQFHTSQAASKPERTFTRLEEALEFWRQEAQDPTLSLPQLTITHHLDHVVRFLSRLTATAEYKNGAARPFLAKRIIEAFHVMAQDEKIKEQAITLIFDGLASCDDRIISALEEVELMIQIDEIEKSPQTETSLRELGKSFFFLEAVNKKVEEFIKTLHHVDEIEVYLAFHIGLADRFKLPVKTRNMIFRRLANITDAKIAKFGDEIEKECTKDQLEAYLQTWSPWIKFQKEQSAPKYETLSLKPLPIKMENLCTITSVTPEQPVFYEGNIYEYDAFIKCYAANGKDPFTQKPIDLKKIFRLEPFFEMKDSFEGIDKDR